jgi:hypothetical protein
MAEKLFQNLYTLGDVVNKQIPGYNKNKSHLLFMIDDKLLTDTGGVRIPASLLKEVTVVKSADMPYFKTALPDAMLIKISTKDKIIHINIRGVASLQ